MIAVFIFYSIANGAQARLAFSDEFKHCNIITYDGDDWIMLDFDRHGYLTRSIKVSDAPRLINALKSLKDVSAVIAVNIAQRKRFMWSPWLVRSCNEICRYAAGIDIGWTFNPVHLYNKLIKYRHKRNYEMLHAWRRKHGISRGGQRPQQRHQ